MSRILLAEGHAPTREFVAAALAQAGFEVLAAGDPQRAYELYAAQRPQAVVLGADGPEADALARRLREANPRLLLVVTDQAHLGRGRGLPALLPLKANAYVADPTRRELVVKVQQLLEQLGPTRTPGLARVLAREPTARGEVRPGSVASLLHQVWRSVWDGVLVLEGGGPTRRLGFRDGAPALVESDDPAEGLLQWLGRDGQLDPTAHQAALEAMAGGLSPAVALAAAGVGDSGPGVPALLARHVEAVVARAVGAREGRWRFHPGAEFDPGGPPLPVRPLLPILEGARAGIPARHLAGALRAVTEAYPVRTGDFPQLLPVAGLERGDLRLALSLDGRLTTRAWLAARPAEMKDALSLLWFLSLVGAVAFHEAPEADGAYGPAAPRRRRPLPFERAEAIRQAALRILPGTYLRALGVDLDAGDAEVEQAYRAVASRFHPDGFGEYDVAELSDLLAAIQDKLAAAYRVLGNAERRRAYLTYLLPRLEQTGARRPGVVLDAELCLRRGERALAGRRPTEAVVALREAVQLAPREPEYLALLAFALLQAPAPRAADAAQEARRLARRALTILPDHPRAAAALALAEEVLGDPASARRVVLSALRVHPQSEVLKRVLFRVNRAR